MRTICFSIAVLLASGTIASAQPDSAKVDAAIVAAFPTAPADWQSRFVQDETMKACSAAENAPSKAVADAIATREKARIEYPAVGKLSGDWKAGEKLAQSGYGLRFTDYPQKQE